VIQSGANAWRAVLWRRHVVWGIVWRFCAASTVTVLLLRLAAFLPSKAFVYIGIGILPLLAELVPRRAAPDITRPLGPYVCGVVVTMLQLLAGAAGHVLDLFFQRGGLDRRAVVATKAVTQTLSHGFRIVYFGSFAAAFDTGLPWWGYAGAVGLAIAGTTAAARVLERMSDADFRVWSRRIVHAIGAVYLARGAWMLIVG
jgi:hypothetical protein